LFLAEKFNIKHFIFNESVSGSSKFKFLKKYAKSHGIFLEPGKIKLKTGEIDFFQSKEIFENEHNVFDASNGEEGLKLAKKCQPTLIISDVMMPVMNGVEFSKKVRQDISISHIPIILLTAKTSEEAEIEGLSSGVDAYINKPFSQKLLKSRVDVLIENRKKLIKKYSLSIDEDLTVLAHNDMDRGFLSKFKMVLEKRYEYSDLSIEELASEMAVSVSGFYTKIKSITGNSPVEFVRIYRLKKAAQLLKSTNLSVTEISEKTGFGTQKYFSNTFKKHFGITPLMYRKS
jgi:YesN/AraC family two-component response regulator